MKKLKTIQEHKLNNIYSVDDTPDGFANYKYAVVPINEEEERIIQTYEPMCEINFHKSFKKDFLHTQCGVTDSDLLEIVRDRLKSTEVCSSIAKCNKEALEHIEMALIYLNERHDKITNELI